MTDNELIDNLQRCDVQLTTRKAEVDAQMAVTGNLIDPQSWADYRRWRASVIGFQKMLLAEKRKRKPVSPPPSQSPHVDALAALLLAYRYVRGEPADPDEALALARLCFQQVRERAKNS